MIRALLAAALVLAALPHAAHAEESPRQLPPDRRDRVLERELTSALNALDERSESPAGSLVFGALAGGGAVWVALEHDARATWAVILGAISVSSLTDGVLQLALANGSEDCADLYRSLPSDTDEDVAARVAAGQLCLVEAAEFGRSYRLAQLVRDFALAGGIVTLWATEPAGARDSTLLILAGAEGAFGLFNLIPSKPELLLGRYERLSERIVAVPATVRDARGGLAPGLALSLAF